MKKCKCNECGNVQNFDLLNCQECGAEMPKAEFKGKNEVVKPKRKKRIRDWLIPAFWSVLLTSVATALLASAGIVGGLIPAGLFAVLFWVFYQNRNQSKKS